MPVSPSDPTPLPAGRRHRRRRRILSRPGDQFRTSLVPTLGAAVLLVILVAAVHHLASIRTHDLASTHPEHRSVLEDQARFIEQSLALGAIVYLFGIMGIGIIHSRRVMGALFAMDRRIRRLASGDLTSTLTLRRGDYFHDVADGINEASEALRRAASEDLADIDDLVHLIDRSPHGGPLSGRVRESLLAIKDRKAHMLDLPVERGLPALETAGSGRST
jgi:hypothetical protein